MGQTPPGLNNCMTPPGTPPCSPEVSAPQPLLKHAQHKGQAPKPTKDSYSLQKALISETLNSQVNSGLANRAGKVCRMSYSQERTGILYFEGRGRAPPFSDYLSIPPIALLRLGRKSQVSFGHLFLTPPQNPSGTHENGACRVSLATVPCQQHPCSQQQQVWVLPLPSHTSQPRAVQRLGLCSATTPHSSAQKSLTSAQLRHCLSGTKPLRGLRWRGLRLLPAQCLCFSPAICAHKGRMGSPGDEDLRHW